MAKKRKSKSDKKEKEDNEDKKKKSVNKGRKRKSNESGNDQSGSEKRLGRRSLDKKREKKRKSEEGSSLRVDKGRKSRKESMQDLKDNGRDKIRDKKMKNSDLSVTKDDEELSNALHMKNDKRGSNRQKSGRSSNVDGQAYIEGDSEYEFVEYSIDHDNEDEPRRRKKDRRIKDDDDEEENGMHEFEEDSNDEPGRNDLGKGPWWPDKRPGYNRNPFKMVVCLSKSGSYESMKKLLRGGFASAARVLLITPWGNFGVFSTCNMLNKLYFVYDGCFADMNEIRYLDLTCGTAGLLHFKNLRRAIEYIIDTREIRTSLHKTLQNMILKLCVNNCKSSNSGDDPCADFVD